MKNLSVTFSAIGGVLLFFGFTQFSQAQGEDAAIIDQSPVSVKKAEDVIIENVKQLIKEKKLLSFEEIKKQLLNPVPQPIELSPVKEKPLPTEEVATLARASNLRVGYCFLCNKCDNWHLNLAGGYPIAADVVATCDHVVNMAQSMREGYLIAADHEGNIYPVTSVLARSVAMDAVLLRVSNAKFSPLPLNGAVRQGASAYCYSTPMEELGYFSNGIVNRFLWNRPYNGGDKKSLDIARHMRVNFSTDWAPGSSGAAVLDQAGNAIGHVSEISGLSKNNNSYTMMTIHIGIPAYGVRILAEAMKNPEDITRLATMEAKEVATRKINRKARTGGPDEKSKDQEKHQEN